ncbi:hypothetical protein [Streptacidiphilus sp. MAP5-3]
MSLTADRRPQMSAEEFEEIAAHMPGSSRVPSMCPGSLNGRLNEIL